MKKLIIAVLALSVVFGVVFYFFAPNFFAPKPVERGPITLTVYGLWEEPKLLEKAIDEFQKANPKIKVDYKYQSSLNYRTRVQTQIEGGEGPDVLMIHDTWLPMFLKSSQLVPMPPAVMKFEDFTKDFYPVVEKTLSKDGRVYGLPRGIDGLALFMNEDITSAAGITEPPKTWPELIDDALKITVIDGQDKITTAGVALGTTGNVDHWSDILGLMLSQMPRVDLAKPNSDDGAEVLRFYTNFANGAIAEPKKRVWDSTLEPSTQAFAGGRLGFYFAPSWRAHELRQINRDLKFKIAPVPQLPGRNIGWGTFWAYAVSSKSPNQEEAWKFVKYLTDAETQKTLFREASNSGDRLFGLPYSRVSLQQELASDPLTGTFVNQAPTYKSWYLSSNTLDQGINDRIIKYFEDAVNTVNQGGDAGQAMDTAAKGVSQVLQEFAPSTPPPAAK